MPRPCITRPDLRSIRAAAQQTQSPGAHSRAIPAEAEPVPGRPRHASGYLNRQHGGAGACAGTGHHGQRAEAGQ
jgi:hypothetical protein